MKNSSWATETILCKPQLHICRPSIPKLLSPGIRKLYSSYKGKLQICLATCAIGAIFLGSFFIFFTQLARFGW